MNIAFPQRSTTSKFVLMFVILIAGFNSANAFSQTSERPNVVFLVAEDCSKHHFKLFDENGVATPNIQALAENGWKYTRAFSNSPVCSVARTTLITGCYAPMLGAHHHRTTPQVQLPATIKMFPTLLREAGYYTTNRHKTDYNVTGGESAWDVSSKKATWRDRAEGQPFFHMQSFGVSHESRLHFPASDLKDKPIADLDSVFVQPRHPDTRLFRYTRARYHQQIEKLDKQIGEVVRQLEEDGLLESTYIFFFGDHGGVLPGTKGTLYETGLHVPLVIRVPEQFRETQREVGIDVERFVSFVDFGPTVLNLADVVVPEHMSGRAFLGSGIDSDEKCQTTFGYADRFDERIGHARSVRRGKFKYIRNYQPWYVDALQNNYRYKMAAFQQWRNMFQDGELNETQSFYFRTNPVEQLYDVLADPYETNNLAADKSHRARILEMRKLVMDQQLAYPDLGFFPESFLRESGEIKVQDNGVSLYEFGLANRTAIEILQFFADTSLDKNAFGREIDIPITNGPADVLGHQWVIGGYIASAAKTDLILKEVESSLTSKDSLGVLRAIEYMAIHHERDPSAPILELLANCETPIAANEILNAVVALRDGPRHFEIVVTEDSLHPNVRSDKIVQRRMEYLTRE